MRADANGDDTEPRATIPATPAGKGPMEQGRREQATLGGGCFWCLEAVYELLRGVDSAVSGYMGGHVVNPTYRQVCGGDTGHVEVVQVTFDPAQITFRDILDVFFTIHDPTTRDRQGGDVGPQYRSAIFYHSAAQQQTAKSAITELEAQRTWHAPIVTEVTSAATFYPAEGYHQGYYRANGMQPYCQIVIAPKVAKARQKFLSRLKR